MKISARIARSLNDNEVAYKCFKMLVKTASFTATEAGLTFVQPLIEYVGISVLEKLAGVEEGFDDKYLEQISRELNLTGTGLNTCTYMCKESRIIRTIILSRWKVVK